MLSNNLYPIPKSGQIELELEKLHQHYRYLLIGNYKIIYRIETDFIIINDVFDTRQNPNKILDKSRKRF